MFAKENISEPKDRMSNITIAKQVNLILDFFSYQTQYMGL